MQGESAIIKLLSKTRTWSDNILISKEYLILLLSYKAGLCVFDYKALFGAYESPGIAWFSSVLQELCCLY